MVVLYSRVTVEMFVHGCSIFLCYSESITSTISGKSQLDPFRIISLIHGQWGKLHLQG